MLSLSCWDCKCRYSLQRNAHTGALGAMSMSMSVGPGTNGLRVLPTDMDNNAFYTTCEGEFPEPPVGVKPDTRLSVLSPRYTVQPLPSTPLPSRRSYGVSDLPESATPEIRLPNLGIPLQQLLTRARLELPSNIRWTVLRVSLHKQVQMYVVVFVRNLQRQNLVAEVIGSLTKQFSHIGFYDIENRVAILAAPHEMILALARTNRMCMTTVLFHSCLHL